MTSDTKTMDLDISSLRQCSVNADPFHFEFTSKTQIFDWGESSSPERTWEIFPGIESGETECEECGGCRVDEHGEDCEKCEGSGTFDPDNGDPDAWQPQMNIAYPLPHLEELPGDWRARLINMTVVRIFDQPHLALTGGGMDMSWAIAETYIRLGYQPPATISELPAMAGRGESEQDKLILQACCTSLENQASQAKAKLSRLKATYTL